MFSFNAKILGLALTLAACSQSAHAWGSHTVGHTPCKKSTVLLPRNSEYRKHCEAEFGGSDSKWPCFSFWAADLNGVDATVTFPTSGIDPDKTIPDNHLLIKNGLKTDFTVRDPTANFTLTWYDDIELVFYNYNKDRGCYSIELHHFTDSSQRIWVSDENNKERIADTEHHHLTSAEICTKWTHIHLKDES